MEEHDILISPTGEISYVYSDVLAEVFAGQPQVTTRASYVEPHIGGGWVCDMRPSGGGFLFPGIEQPADAPVALLQAMYGFPTHTAALAAERAWLRTNKQL